MMPSADAAAAEHVLVMYTCPKSLISILIQNSARVHSLQVVPRTPIHAAGESSSANETRSLECIASLTMRANVPARLSTAVQLSRCWRGSFHNKKCSTEWCLDRLTERNVWYHASIMHRAGAAAVVHDPVISTRPEKR
jgi:hypothetical protein